MQPAVRHQVHVVTPPKPKKPKYPKMINTLPRIGAPFLIGDDVALIGRGVGFNRRQYPKRSRMPAFVGEPLFVREPRFDMSLLPLLREGKWYVLLYL